MRSPAFWDASPRHPAALALAPFGALYGRLTAARMDRPGLPGPCPVLCVGNLTLGGAGKTPTALALAGLLRDLGAAPAFLTRGYGGRLGGPIRVDPARHDATDVGDEALLLAWVAPTVVARDRPAGASLCAASGADVVVMDDGLQNPSLTKDFAIAVVDAVSGLGNGLTFPAGPLRVPLARQWPHVDALVLIGDGAAGERVAETAARRGLPVHRGRLAPDPAGPNLAGRKVFAFAGIGRPDKFYDTLREAGADVVGQRSFPDHHRFCQSDMRDLAMAARTCDATLVTTQKDRVRLPAAFAAEVLAVRLRFADPADLVAALRRLIEDRRDIHRT